MPSRSKTPESTESLSALRREKSLIELLQAAAVTANETSSVESTVNICLEHVCAYTGWPIGHWFYLDKKFPDRMTSSSIWFLEDEKAFSDFRRKTEVSAFERNIGLPGQVMATGEPRWIVDIATAPNFPRGKVAEACGIRSGFGFPVLVGKQVVGVLEFFTSERVPPDDRLTRVMKNVCAQIARVVERKESEEQLILAREQALQASLEKSRFIANVSHEIRTPLNALIGAVDLVILSKVSKPKLAHLRTMKEATASLLDVISGVLDVAKIESGHLELNEAEFAPRETLARVHKLFEQELRKKKLRLKIAIDADVPRALVGDAVRLKQILINLVGNAVKFTEKGGITIHLSRRGRGLRFRIADSGIGIPSRAIARLFEPFTQVDSSSTRRHGGTGLGLSISRQIATAMGGNIGLKSVEAKGTVVTLDLPFMTPTAPKKAKSGGLPSRRVSPAQKPRALLVEDNPVNCRIMAEMLKQSGYRSVIARGGKEGVAAFTPGKFAVVLMDCQMPGLDGYEATRQMRTAERATSRVPIIGVTANATKADRELCLRAGMDDYIPKPIELKTLQRALTKWLPFGAGAVNRVAWDNVRKFQRPGKPDILRELIEIYLESGGSQVRAIVKAAERSQLEIVAREAHGLSSSSANIGCESVTRLAELLEKASRRRLEKSAKKLAHELARQFHELRPLLEDQCKKS